MSPGEHLIVFTLPKVLAARAAGFQLRDAITILTAGPQTLSAFLLRVPLEGTVAETVLGWERGGLNVDGCRVGYGGKSLEEVRKEAGSPGKQGSTCQVEYGGGWAIRETPVAFHPFGRWPPNLLLVHGEGCQRVGEKQVRGSGKDNPEYRGKATRTGNTYAQDEWPKHHFDWSAVSHVNQDGTETVPSYGCQSDCPVRLLDGLSGELRTNPGKITSKMASMGYHGGVGSSRSVLADVGTASRFFPQFTSLQEALDWLKLLIGTHG